MKRAAFLFVLIALVMWLVQITPAETGTGTGKQPTESNSNPAALPTPTPPESCCADPNESDPHWECFGNSCVQVSGCGVNVDCATCGCDPAQEWVCLSNGGQWNPLNCTCNYTCDPTGSQQQACLSQGGYWDSLNCLCYYGPTCDPTGALEQACIAAGRTWNESTCTCEDVTICVCDDPVLIGTDEYPYEYCDGYYYQYCTDTYYHYQANCEGPCGPSYWTEHTSSCISFGEYCGDDGGGGTDECWITGDCWCDEWWGICCEWDDCYPIEELPTS